MLERMKSRSIRAASVVRVGDDGGARMQLYRWTQRITVEERGWCAGGERALRRTHGPLVRHYIGVGLLLASALPARQHRVHSASELD